MLALKVALSTIFRLTDLSEFITRFGLEPDMAQRRYFFYVLTPIRYLIGELLADN